MYGGLWDAWDDTTTFQVIQLYSIGRRLDIRNLPQIASDHLNYCLEQEPIEAGDLNDIVAVAYRDIPDVGELDQRVRKLLVDHIVERFLSREYCREWFEELFTISSAFAYEFAEKISFGAKK